MLPLPPSRKLHTPDNSPFPSHPQVCDRAWPTDASVQATNGTILFYQGAESAMRSPGPRALIREHARRLNALVLALEHRYYGASMPLGYAEGEVPTKALKWLQVEQAVEDSAAFLAAMRSQLQVPASVPAIIMGGSYGGELVAWVRASKPESFAAAIASR